MKYPKYKFIAFLFLFFYLFGINFAFAQTAKYPDYAYEFLGEDKYENYNRKMFIFNQRLNRYIIRPVHIVWASIMPQYGMDRILGISNNIEYPIRFVSCLVQGDFKAAGQESARFLINTTIGLAGMFDPAKHILKVEQVHENMEQALAKRKIRAKRFFVLPVISFTTYRGVAGKILDAALNPSTYIGTPVLAAIKAGLTINRTSYFQVLIKLLENNYADPYEFYKTAYGIDAYAKLNNYDRVDVISQLNADPNAIHRKKNKKVKLDVEASISKESVQNPKSVVLDKEETNTKAEKTTKQDMRPVSQIDIALLNYNPQSPFVDSMRTSLFYLPSSDKSFWNEMSIWNRSFKKRIKTSEISLAQDRDKYRFRYLIQKDKNAPLAIILPSIGEGVMSSHSVMFAKIFYDSGYSILIMGNPFQWEYVKSMPEGYHPGLPQNDAKMLRKSISKIVEKLEKKYKRNFDEKVLLGTSYAATTLLFTAEQESKENTLGNIKFISICPQVDLIYAMNQVDRNYEEWDFSSDRFKNTVAGVAGKIVRLYTAKENKEVNFEINKLPFSEDEAKLITGFIMHQKLSDIIFVAENAPKNKKSGIYEEINNMGYKDYVEKYLISDNKVENQKTLNNTKLTSISSYLKKADNYRIYHSANDYLTSPAQMKQLRQIAGKKLTIVDNGSHLGFLYRPEFIRDLYKTVLDMRLKDKENL